MKIYISTPHIRENLLLLCDLKDKIKEAGFTVVNDHLIACPDTIIDYPDAILLDAIHEQIIESDLFLFVIDSNSMMVLSYELGYAAGVGKKIIILTDSSINSKYVGFFSSYRFFSLSDEGLHKFLCYVKDHLNEFISNVDETKTLQQFIAKVQQNPSVLLMAPYNKFESYLYDYFLGQKNRCERQQIAENMDVIWQSKDSIHHDCDFILINFDGYKETVVEAKLLNTNHIIPAHVIQKIIDVKNKRKADRAILITTAEFSTSAKKLAESQDNVELWDLNHLSKKILDC